MRLEAALKLFAPVLICVLLIGTGGFAAPKSDAESETIPIGFFGAADSAVRRGAALGIEEATRAARYFGYQFELDPTGEASLVIAGLRDRAALEELANPKRLVVNALATTRGPCRPGLFHVAASDAMLQYANELREVTGEDPGPRVVTWHPSLIRFAARDLNRRYQKRFGEAMTGEAWSGWAAGRSLGEAVLRQRSADPTVLAAYFLGDFALDGQKGEPLRFRPDHQLSQPLYYVSRDDKVIGEMQFKSRAQSDLGDSGCPSE